MSTNSKIIVQNPEKNEWVSVYAHWDGYLSHMGKMLLNHYNTYEKAVALVKLGSISSVNERIAPEVGESHTFERPSRGVTIAYHRDRGDPYRIERSSVLEEHCDQEYCYLFKDGKWFWKHGYNNRSVFRELTQLDIQRN